MNNYRMRMLVKKAKRRKMMREMEAPEKQGHSSQGAQPRSTGAKNRIV